MERFPISWPTIADLEREHVLDTLLRCDGNRTRAATLLGISVRGLRTKLSAYAKQGFAVHRPGGSACFVNFLGRPGLPQDRPYS
jgi:hypothetical protein